MTAWILVGIVVVLLAALCVVVRSHTVVTTRLLDAVMVKSEDYAAMRKVELEGQKPRPDENGDMKPGGKAWYAEPPKVEGDGARTVIDSRV